MSSSANAVDAIVARDAVKTFGDKRALDGVGFAAPAGQVCGVLYRALDREWGGVRAVAGAALFFAVYHPVLSWVPVAAHMAYNAIVLAF